MADWQRKKFATLTLTNSKHQNASKIKMIGSPEVMDSENTPPLQCTKCILNSGSKGTLSQCNHHSLGTPTRPAMKVIDTNIRKRSSSLRSREPWEKLSTFRGGKLVIVEGNIGVGKTTLTQRLADDLQYKVFLEPSTDNPFLGKIN